MAWPFFRSGCGANSESEALSGGDEIAFCSSRGDMSASRQSAERLFERYSEAWREQLRGSVGGDDHIVFAAQAEFSGNVNSRLVRKRHACFQYGFAAAHKIRMLVPVEPDAVSQAVREKFVVRPVARAGDDRARCIIDRSRQLTRARGVQSSV